MIASLNYEGIESPVFKKLITRLKQKIMSILKYLHVKIIKIQKYVNNII